MDIARTFALWLAAATLAAPVAAEPPQPPAPDWQPLYKSGGLLSLSWDRAGIVRRGDLVEIVIRAETPARAGGTRHADFLNELRCSDRRIRVVRTTNYAPDGAAIVDETPKAKFFKIKPGTWNETLRAALC